MSNRFQRLVPPLVLLVTLFEPTAASPRTDTRNLPPIVATETIRGALPGTWRVIRTRRATDVRWESGATSWSRRIPGPFGLPVVTSRGLRAGPTLDGAAIVLASAPLRVGTKWSSSFAVVTKTRARTISLPGQWAFDAISPNGNNLFLTESVGPGRYWVRSVDTTTGKAGAPLVTKAISFDPPTTAVEDGPMEGMPLDRIASPDGLVLYTLYESPSHPFIHALNIGDGWALCYDLPDTLRSRVLGFVLRSGLADGIIDVVDAGAIAAQITLPGSKFGTSVRLPGTSRPPVVN